MEITIKTIRGIAVSNILILGLAACSSSPAPWKQDDDPWVSKRNAEAESVPSDEAVTDTSLNDPVLLAEPEGAIVMEEPAAAEPELIIAVEVKEELSNEQVILAMPATNYAVQVYASKTTESVEAFKTNNGLENLMAVKTVRSGGTIYVLVDVYPDRAAANAAAVDLETTIGSKPWVRSVAGLHEIVSE